MLQVPHGELHAAGAGEPVRAADLRLERRGPRPRDGLRAERGRGRGQTGAAHRAHNKESNIVV